MEYSLIIPSYNDAAKLLRCLRSLRALDPPTGDWEVLVSIDGSTDGTREMLDLACGRRPGEAPAREPIEPRDTDGQSDAGPRITRGELAELPLRVLDSRENRGRSAARNAALKTAGGEWLLFLDADLRVEADWVARLRDVQASERVVAVGRMAYEILDPAGRALPLRRYQNYLQTRGPWKYRRREEMPARYFYTCNSCVHRGLLERAGGFDERMRIWGGEDIDMGIRLGQAGAKMVFSPQARAWHAQERSFRAHCRNLERFGRKVLPLLLKKHPWLREELRLDRLLPAEAGGRPSQLLRLLSGLRVERLMLAWEELSNGLFFTDRLYDLTVFLHYAGGYVEFSGKNQGGGVPPAEDQQS